MITTKAEYQKRKNEVAKYIEAVKQLDKGECQIVCTDILGNKTSTLIDNELSKILKANSFILLYNLIESTITNSITAVANSISNDKLTYEQLSDAIKHLWIRQEVKNVKDISQYVPKVSQIAATIVNNDLLSFTSLCVDISGNIDAKKIRDIAKQVGWEESKDGRDLVTIKNKRNHLAHGEYTFVDVGKNYSISDLLQFQKKTVEYLDDVLSKVEIFISKRGYKK